MIILLLIQYFGQRPLSRKNMHFSINYIVSVHHFKFVFKTNSKWWNRDYVVDTEVHVFLDKGLWPKYVFKTNSKWWNIDYVVDTEVHVFLDKGLWPKY